MHFMVALVAVFVACLPVFATAAGVRVTMDDRGGFNVTINGSAQPWLRSAPIRLFTRGTWYTSVGQGEQALTATGVRRYDGKDSLGSFACHNLTWTADPDIVLYTSLKAYESGIFVFQQDIPEGLVETNASTATIPTDTSVNNGEFPPVVSFPAFAADDENGPSLVGKLGFVTWHAVMSGMQSGANAPASLTGLSSSGPVALFDEDFNTLVVSPLDNFKSVVHTTVGNGQSLVQLFSTDRHDHALCLMGTQCWIANHNQYAFQRVEALIPSDADVTRHAARLGVSEDELAQPLANFFSMDRLDNRATNATKPPPNAGYCAQADYCFPNGRVYVMQVRGTVPLQLYFSQTHNDSLSVASPQGIAYAKAHGYAFVKVVGYVYGYNGPSSLPTPVWATGVTSELTSLPRGFSHRTLLMGGSGVTATMDAWGTAVRSVYGTKRMSDSDPVVNYLSYWTDNGAYYYGDAWKQAGGGGDPCNETSMEAVADGLEAKKLLDATHIWQLDDWWYPGPQSIWVHCVENWTLTAPAFNTTLKDLSKRVKTPWLLYVPFFCEDNVYTSEFEFVIGAHGRFAEPHPDNALAFYRMLFDYGVSQGMAGYENDFLNFNLLAVPYFRSTFGASNTWLASINTAALERELPVQMCMALPSDLMASLQFDAVTNYRCTGDYASGSNIDIGGSALLAFGLGLRPSKDNFWTHRPESAIETGKPWGPHDNPGSNCELNTIVATLSTGPVGIADKAGDTNETLVWRSVAQDGRIIQPDKPVTIIDAMLCHNCKRGRPAGQVWATYATVADRTWHYVLSMDVTSQAWQLSGVDFYPMVNASSGWVARRWHQNHHPAPCPDGADAGTSGCVQLPAVRSEATLPRVHNTRPIQIVNDTHTFDLLQLSPIEANGWVFLGDTARYVSVSAKRFISVNTTATGLTVTAVGSPKESLTLVALKPKESGSWSVVTRTVDCDGQGKATAAFH